MLGHAGVHAHHAGPIRRRFLAFCSLGNYAKSDASYCNQLELILRTVPTSRVLIGQPGITGKVPGLNGLYVRGLFCQVDLVKEGLLHVYSLS